MHGSDTVAGGLPRKLDGLQVGRALAAIAVVVGHAVAVSRGGHADHLWHMLGRYGVTLFFVISGFIMMHTTGPAPFKAKRFISNRLRRILPIYYFANVVLVAATLILPQAFKHTEFDLTHLLLSLAFVPAYAPGDPTLIAPFFRLGWTLNFEMFFYVCFASLFFLGARARAAVLTAWFGILIAIGLAYPFASAIPRFYTQIDTLGFVAGVLLGLASIEGRLRMSRATLGILAAASLAGFGWLSVYIDAIRDSPWTQVATVAICTIHVAALIVAIDTTDRGRVRLRAPRWLTFVGDSSYSLYLFHMFSIGAVVAVARRVMPTAETPTIVVAIAVSLAAGTLAYALVERPLNRLFRRNRPLTAAQIGEDAATTRPDAPAPAPR